MNKCITISHLERVIESKIQSDGHSVLKKNNECIRSLTYSLKILLCDFLLRHMPLWTYWCIHVYHCKDIKDDDKLLTTFTLWCTYVIPCILLCIYVICLKLSLVFSNDISRVACLNLMVNMLTRPRTIQARASTIFQFMVMRQRFVHAIVGMFSPAKVTRQFYLGNSLRLKPS